MWTDSITPIAVAVLTVVGAVLARPVQSRGRRAQIATDLDILSKLPEGSATQEPLERHIDLMIERLIREQYRKPLDPAGIVLAVLFLAAALGLTYAFVQVEAWWRWVLLLGAVAAAVFGLVGGATEVFENPRKVPDESSTD